MAHPHEPLEHFFVDDVASDFLVELAVEPRDQASRFSSGEGIEADHRAVGMTLVKVLANRDAVRERHARFLDENWHLAGGVQAPENLSARSQYFSNASSKRRSFSPRTIRTLRLNGHSQK